MVGLHLVRRGGVYWWRRRLPSALLHARGCDSALHEALTDDPVDTSPKAERIRRPTHVSLSLRTRCPREARRRAVRLTALCDHAWSLQMTIANAAGPVPHPLVLADGLLSFLGKGVDAYQSTLALHPADPAARAEAEDRAEAELKAEIRAAVGAPRGSVAALEGVDAARPEPPPSPHTLFMKAEIATLHTQIAALREQERKIDEHGRKIDERRSMGADLAVVLGRVEDLLADRRPPPGAAFAATPDDHAAAAGRAGDAPAPKPDPAGAHAPSPRSATSERPREKPELVRAAGLPEAQVERRRGRSAEAASGLAYPDPAPPPTRAAHGDPADPAVPPAPGRDAAQGASAGALLGASGESGAAREADPDRISVVGREWLDLRCAGYLLKRKKETPIPEKGESFRQNSRKNIESTLDILVDLVGDVRPDRLTDERIEDFVELLQKIPRNHGKSSRDRRPLRVVVEETEREEQLAIIVAKQATKELGASEGNIEAACHAARIPRLSTATCVRHMRDGSRVFDHWVKTGRIERNPLKDYLWTKEEIELRMLREADRERRPWGGKLASLLATPVFLAGPTDPGDPLFWAPLIAEFQGLRMEEVLQLGPDDVEEDEGVLVLRVRITNTAHRLKSKNARRSAPIHRSLIELGFLELVAHARREGERRLFPHAKRGKSKGSLSEIFTKHYKRYRERHKVYDPQRDFHSHRTGFFTNLRAAGVPLDARKMLMGHVESDMSIVHYDPDRYSLRQLHEFVNRIEIEVSRVARPFVTKTGDLPSNVVELTGLKKP